MNTPEEKWCNWCKQEHDWNKDCSSLSPEARVDWEAEAREIVQKYIGKWVFVQDGKVEAALMPLITKALSAAFEKGREAR